MRKFREKSMTRAEFTSRVANLPQEPNCGCTIWDGASRGKYPGPTVDGVARYGHVLTLEDKLGRKLGPGKIAMHKCDTPMCVNQDHLIEGTHSENSKDMWNKGRQVFQKYPEKKAFGDRNGRRKHPENYWTPSGEASVHSKVTDQIVREIREKYKTGRYTQNEIAREYGISQSRTSSIILRDSWKHVA